MIQHTGQVDEAAWSASCVCGWQGEPHVRYSDAYADLCAHLDAQHTDHTNGSMT